MFKLFDKDGSGEISTHEIRDVLVPKSTKKGMVNEGNKIWDQILKEIDTDGSGEIDFNEFKVMMEKLLFEDFNQNENDEYFEN